MGVLYTDGCGGTRMGGEGGEEGAEGGRGWQEEGGGGGGAKAEDGDGMKGAAVCWTPYGLVVLL